MKALNTALVSLSLIGLSMQASIAAEIKRTADYVTIGIEAEDFDFKDERWVLTNSNTDQLPGEEDPDPNHSGSASGGVYFEVLPDIRVTHDDPQFPPVAFWGQAGTGPEMRWDVDVPEPGRYYVHARAYSTGTEDNGMHVGLNGQWPDSGRTMQFCTAGARAWKWSSAQRDAGGVGSCGIQKTLYLDIEEAGPNTIMVSAREDGFELDRLLLMKDLSAGTRTCTPTTATGVSCRNGGIEMEDGETDMAVSIVTDPVTIADGTDMMSSGNSFRISVIIENHDRFDHGENIVVSTEFAAGLKVRGVSPECSFEGLVVTCNLDDLEPSAPGEFHKFDMAIDVIDGGTTVRPITAFVTNDLIDANEDDNVFTVDVLISDPNDDLSTDIGVALDVTRDIGNSDGTWAVGELGKINLDVFNASNQASGAVDVRLQFTEGVAVDLMPNECSGTNPITCSYLNVDADTSHQLEFEINAAAAGNQLITAITSVANDENSANNRDSDFVVFEGQMVIPSEEVEEEEELVQEEVEEEIVEEEQEEEEPVQEEEAVEESTDDSELNETDNTVETEISENQDQTLEENDSDSELEFPLPLNPNNETAVVVPGDVADPTEPLTVINVPQPTVSVIDTGATETATSDTTTSSSSGALSWQVLLAMLLLVSTCMYGRHKRQAIAVRHLS